MPYARIYQHRTLSALPTMKYHNSSYQHQQKITLSSHKHTHNFGPKSFVHDENESQKEEQGEKLAKDTKIIYSILLMS
jgi:hypothetical protein